MLMRKTDRIRASVLRSCLAGLAAIATVWLSQADALDNPHNKVINCATCHQTPSAIWWTDQGASGGLCGQCHFPGSPAGDGDTHQVSEAYGSQRILCTFCHNPHYQKQYRTWKSSSWLASGTISSASATSLVRSGSTPAWYSDQWKGMLLIANVGFVQYNYRIAASTATTIIIDTSGGDSINLAIATPGSTFAVVYGRLVKEAVAGRPVRFFRKEGQNSFADDDGTIDGVCQVCHLRAGSFTASGVLEGTGHPSLQAGLDCGRCHQHQTGFTPQCGACHGSPPLSSVLGGPDGLADNEGGTGSAASGAHGRHAAEYRYACETCHTAGMPASAVYDKLIQIGFSLFRGAYQSGAYDGRTLPLANGYGYAPGGSGTVITNAGTMQCSNVYCHGAYPGSGLISAPAWTGTAACGSCHGASNITIPNSGSHLKHASRDVHNYSCVLCHAGTVAGAGPDQYAVDDRVRHANGFVDWEFDVRDPMVSTLSSYSIVSGTGKPSNGITPRQYGTCANLYCHSIAQTGNGQPLSGAPGEYASPFWGMDGGGSRYCGPCHKNGSHHNDGVPAPMDSGSHLKHLSYGFNTGSSRYSPSYKCAICHRFEQQSAGAYTSCDPCHTTGAVYSGHVNGRVDIRIDTAFGSAAYDDTSPSPGSPGNGFFSCTNTYCHSNGTSVAGGAIPPNTTKVWGSAVLACDACHGNGPAYPDGSPKANSHQVHAAAPYAFSCNYCHVTTTSDGAGIASTVAHVNKAYDCSPDTTRTFTDAGGTVSVNFTYTFASSGGTCSGITCHQTRGIEPTAIWGGTAAPVN